MTKKKIMVRTQQLSVAEMRTYFNEHTEKTKHKGIFKVIKPMKVWKQTNFPTYPYGKVIVALEIPVGALVHARMFGSYCAPDGIMDSTLSYRKMRASIANVVAQFHVHRIGGNGIYKKRPGNYQFSVGRYESVDMSISGWASGFQYKTGNTVKPTYKFCMDDEQCASGVHFFINLSDAMKW